MIVEMIVIWDNRLGHRVNIRGYIFNVKSYFFNIKSYFFNIPVWIFKWQDWLLYRHWCTKWDCGYNLKISIKFLILTFIFFILTIIFLIEEKINSESKKSSHGVFTLDMGWDTKNNKLVLSSNAGELPNPIFFRGSCHLWQKNSGHCCAWSVCDLARTEFWSSKWHTRLVKWELMWRFQ